MAHESRELQLGNLLRILEDGVNALRRHTQALSWHVVDTERFLLALDVKLDVAFVGREEVLNLHDVMVLVHRAAVLKAGRARACTAFFAPHSIISVPKLVNYFSRC